MPTARLTDRSVIAVGGPGAEAFLQSLVTNAVTPARPGWSTYAALLTPQGKIQFDFLLHADADGYLIDVLAAKADDLLKRLKLYRLRAPITLAPRPDLAVFASWDHSTLPHPDEGAPAPVSKDAPPPDPRLPALGQRWIAAEASIAPDADLIAYTQHRLALGVPDTADVENEFALDANFEELHGVDFRKGCFVGQEVTARMKHKAQPRRRIVPLAVESETPPGTKLVGDDGTEVGTVTSGANGFALASVRLERLRAASALRAGAQPATLRPGAYRLPLLPT